MSTLTMSEVKSAIRWVNIFFFKKSLINVISIYKAEKEKSKNQTFSTPWRWPNAKNILFLKSIFKLEANIVDKMLFFYIFLLIFQYQMGYVG